jgi:hypothetical protein
VPVADPPGSGYFLATVNRHAGDLNSTHLRFETLGGSPGYVLDDPSTVIMLDGGRTQQSYGSMVDDTTLEVVLGSGTFLNVEAVVADRIRLQGPGSGVVSATVPARADLEYQTAAGNVVWTGGVPSMASVFAAPDRCCYNVNNVLLHGMGIGTAVVNGSAVVVGSVDNVNFVESNSTLDLYFDEDRAAQVPFAIPTPLDIEFTAASWD